MKTKKRPEESMPSKNGCTRHFYIPNILFDKLLQESAEKDVSVSQLLRSKLQLLDQIEFIVLQNNHNNNHK